MIRAARYGRISADSERTGLAPARQFYELDPLIARKHFTVTHTFIDNDISAARANGNLPVRPEFNRMCQFITAGEIDAVVAWDTDRLLRDPLEAEQFLLLCERAGMCHISTLADEVDISTGDGLMVFRIKTAVAAEEVRKIRKRVAAKQAERARDGLPHGYAPFGYRRDLVAAPDSRHPQPIPTFVINETEAGYVERAASDVLAGRGFNAIARDWNAAGLTTRSGGRWTGQYVARFLTNPTLAGLRRHRVKATRQVTVVPGVWEPIIDLHTHRALVALRDMKPGRGVNQPPRKHPLSGLVMCGRCRERGVSSAMQVQSDRRVARRGYVEYHDYRCRECNNSISMTRLRNHVVLVLSALATSKTVRDATTRRQQDASIVTHSHLHAEQVELRARLSELEDDYYGPTRIIDRADYDRIKGRLMERLGVIAGQLDATPPAPDADAHARAEHMDMGEWAAWWSGLTVDRQTAIARYYLERVVAAGAAALGSASVPEERLSITVAHSIASAGLTMRGRPVASSESAGSAA